MPEGAGMTAVDSLPRTDKVLVLACGALAREILTLIRLNGWTHLTMECLPAKLHHTPDKITPAIASRLEKIGDTYDKVLIGYGDCGTGGHLDALIAKHDNVERLPGAHCYEFFATTPVFMGLHEAELGTFYLTDFLAKHFDRFVFEYLGLDRHPELRDMYFGNYRKLVYMSQIDSEELVAMAAEAAERLGLEFSHLRVAYGELENSLKSYEPDAEAG